MKTELRSIDSFKYVVTNSFTLCHYAAKTKKEAEKIVREIYRRGDVATENSLEAKPEIYTKQEWLDFSEPEYAQKEEFEFDVL
jgi:hypothetical protein